MDVRRAIASPSGPERVYVDAWTSRSTGWGRNFTHGWIKWGEPGLATFLSDVKLLVRGGGENLANTLQLPRPLDDGNDPRQEKVDLWRSSNSKPPSRPDSDSYVAGIAELSGH
jgi:hypothetical protein